MKATLYNKMKFMLLAAAVAFATTAAFVACDKQDDEPTPPEIPIQIKVAASQVNDTLQVPYNGTLDLSTIFSLEQTQGGTATLTYTIDRQPDYAEGTNEEYMLVEAYRVQSNTLTAIQGVRVPDAVNVPDDNRLRAVREGKLKISTLGVDTTFVIVQTGKPALVPTIALDTEITGLDNGTLTLTTTGQPRTFNATYFTISPIDFGISDIRIGIGEGAYITPSLSGVPQAGGLSGTAGTDGYIVAYYKGNTLEEVKADANLPQAKLYINVEYVAPTAAVGIELNPNIGAAAATRFATTSNRRMPNAFIVLKLNDGTTRAYDGTTDSALGFLAGNFDSYMEGKTTQSTDFPGWWSYVGLKAADPVPPVGTTVSFDVTSKLHFNEPEWTVRVTTQTVASANP